MIWGPFLLALALGLVVSAGLYFTYLWPVVEPDDDAEDAGDEPSAAQAAAAGSETAQTAEPLAETTTGDPEPRETDA